MKNHWLDKKKEDEKKEEKSSSEEYDEDGYYKNIQFKVMPKAFYYPKI